MKTLVIYYSKSGNTKKIAEGIASSQIFDIEEIIDPKERKGIIGWILAGKNALLKKSTPIEQIKSNISDYDLVILGTPIWVYSMAIPVRSFLKEHKDKIKNVAFFATMGKDGDKQTFAEMQSICNKEPLLTASFTENQIKNNAYIEDLYRFIVGIEKITEA